MFQLFKDPNKYIAVIWLAFLLSLSGISFPSEIRAETAASSSDTQP